MSGLTPSKPTQKPGNTLSYRQRLTRPFRKSTVPTNSSFLAPLTNQAQPNKLEAINSVPVNVNFSDELLSLITRSLSISPLFYALPSTEVQHLISKLGFYEIGPQETIYKEHYPPTNFYILTEGKAVMRSNSNTVRELGPGSSFGETSLINGNPRYHTVETLVSSSYVTLELEDFNYYFKLAQKYNYEVLRNFNYALKPLEALPSQFIDALSKFAVLMRFCAGDNIVTEGESGSILYFILEGDAVVSVNNEEIRRLYPGDCFGEQALLYDGIRTATVNAVTEIKCEAVPKQVLYRLFGSNLDDFIYTNTARIAFDKNPRLKYLSSSEKERLIEDMRITTYGYDEIVIPVGTETSNSLLIVLNGSLCARRGLEVRESGNFASVYDCIGVEEVSAGYSDSVFETDIVADTDEVAIGEIGKAAFHACLGTAESVLRSVSVRQFKGIQILEELPREKQMAIVKVLVVREYSHGDPICQQNEPGDQFYILKSGRAAIFRDGVLVRTVTKSDYFGEKSLLIDQPRTASIFSEGHSVVWILNRENFNKFFDDRTKAMMKNRIERLDVTLTLQDLIPVARLGKGQFGCVFLVASRGDEIFALKAVDRRKINTAEQCKYILMERSVLMEINHRFIMKLIKTFKDQQYVYFLTEYIKGATLFDILHDCGHFTVEESTFYVAIIVKILEYLHERDIVHRDLKPENMMVSEDGYLKLIDFGTAKVIHGRTYTRLGTAWYMAPEVILNKGYGASADLWSLGVMLYEFVCGRVPFGEEEEDPYNALKIIPDEDLVFPSFFRESSDCKTLITQLLQKNPYNRITLHDIKRHKMFRNFDWNALMTCAVRGPKFPPEPKNFLKIIQSAKRKNVSLHRALEVFSTQDAHSDDEDLEEENIQEGRRPPPPNWDDQF